VDSTGGGEGQEGRRRIAAVFGAAVSAATSVAPQQRALALKSVTHERSTATPLRPAEFVALVNAHAQEMQRRRESASVGLGVIIQMEETEVGERAVITECLPGGLALASGRVRAGDVLIGVDGVSVRDLSVQDLRQLTRVGQPVSTLACDAKDRPALLSPAHLTILRPIHPDFGGKELEASNHESERKRPAGLEDIQLEGHHMQRLEVSLIDVRSRTYIQEPLGTEADGRGEKEQVEAWLDRETREAAVSCMATWSSLASKTAAVQAAERRSQRLCHLLLPTDASASSLSSSHPSLLEHGAHDYVPERRHEQEAAAEEEEDDVLKALVEAAMGHEDKDEEKMNTLGEQELLQRTQELTNRVASLLRWLHLTCRGRHATEEHCKQVQRLYQEQCAQAMRAEASLKDAVDSAAASKAEVKRLRKELKSMHSRFNDSVTNAHADAHRQVVAALEEEQAQSSKKHIALTNSLRQVQRALENKKALATQLQHKLAAAETRASEAESKAGKMLQRLASLEAGLEAAKREAALARRAPQAIKADLDDARLQLSQANAARDKAEERAAQARKTAHSKSTQAEDLRIQVSKWQTACEFAQQLHEQALKQVQAKDKQLQAAFSASRHIDLVLARCAGDVEALLVLFDAAVLHLQEQREARGCLAVELEMVQTCSTRAQHRAHVLAANHGIARGLADDVVRECSHLSSLLEEILCGVSLAGEMDGKREEEALVRQCHLESRVEFLQEALGLEKQKLLQAQQADAQAQTQVEEDMKSLRKALSLEKQKLVQAQQAQAQAQAQAQEDIECLQRRAEAQEEQLECLRVAADSALDRAAAAEFVQQQYMDEQTEQLMVAAHLEAFLVAVSAQALDVLQAVEEAVQHAAGAALRVRACEASCATRMTAMHARLEAVKACVFAACEGLASDSSAALALARDLAPEPSHGESQVLVLQLREQIKQLVSDKHAAQEKMQWQGRKAAEVIEALRKERERNQEEMKGWWNECDLLRRERDAVVEDADKLRVELLAMRHMPSFDTPSSHSPSSLLCLSPRNQFEDFTRQDRAGSAAGGGPSRLHSTADVCGRGVIGISFETRSPPNRGSGTSPRACKRASTHEAVPARSRSNGLVDREQHDFLLEKFRQSRLLLVCTLVFMGGCGMWVWYMLLTFERPVRRRTSVSWRTSRASETQVSNA
jgi:hypothetical protein